VTGNSAESRPGTRTWLRPLLGLLASTGALFAVVWVVFKLLLEEAVKKAGEGVINAVSTDARYAATLFATLFMATSVWGLWKRHLASTRETENAQLKANLRAASESDTVCKIVLFLSPSAEAFYVQYYKLLVQEAHKRASAKQQVVVAALWPTDSFRGAEPPEMCVELVKKYRNISGVFLIPKDPEIPANRDGIVRFKGEYSTVMLDVYSGTEPADDMPHFVGGDEKYGGGKAAELAMEFFRSAGKTPRAILMLRGRQTNWERQRIEHFKIQLEPMLAASGWKDVKFAESPQDLDYSRERAKGFIRGLIDDPTELKPLFGQQATSIRQVDLIFACNDEMAIGACEALREFATKTGLEPRTLPKVIGYDGTQALVDQLTHKNEYILGTVDVSLPDQASLAMDLMCSLLHERGTSTSNPKFELVKPKQLRNGAVIYPESQ
jgi:ABC-type sugar transport system substrate-binding protein